VVVPKLFILWHISPSFLHGRTGLAWCDYKSTYCGNPKRIVESNCVELVGKRVKVVIVVEVASRALGGHPTPMVTWTMELS
jgi:hypothetical protein